MTVGRSLYQAALKNFSAECPSLLPDSRWNRFGFVGSAVECLLPRRRRQDGRCACRLPSREAGRAVQDPALLDYRSLWGNPSILRRENPLARSHRLDQLLYALSQSQRLRQSYVREPLGSGGSKEQGALGIQESHLAVLRPSYDGNCSGLA